MNHATKFPFLISVAALNKAPTIPGEYRPSRIKGIEISSHVPQNVLFSIFVQNSTVLSISKLSIFQSIEKIRTHI